MARKQVYELLFSYEAPDIVQSQTSNTQVTKFFREGDKIIADLYGNDSVIVDNRFVFPLEYVEKTDEFPFLKENSSMDETIDRIKVQSVMIGDKEREKLDEFGQNAKSIVEGKRAEQVKNETKTYKNGVLVGLGIGIITALYFKKNIWIFSLLGASVGGYVAYNITKAKKGNNIIEKS